MAEAPISLYIDLEVGHVADLEVVARAALAWSAAIKELTFVLDPSLDVRLELASGTTGSLSLNSIVRVAREVYRNQTFRTLVITATFWAISHTGDYTFDRILDWLTGADAPQEAHDLSEKEIQEIADRVARALQGRVAKSQIQQMYRELERDPSITGVGTTSAPGARPKVVIPRSEFPVRAGHAEIRQETITRRTIPERMEVVLIRPALVHDRHRRWRFRGPNGEFGANMKDAGFLKRVLSGAMAIPMVSGIEMVIVVETNQELHAGVWEVLDRDVVEVLQVRSPWRQSFLPFASPEDENGDADEDDEDGDPESESGVD